MSVQIHCRFQCEGENIWTGEEESALEEGLRFSNSVSHTDS